MNSDFENVYEDEERASAYAELEFPGTYYLAFRDLPMLFEKYASGLRALDFGCGTGRSSRFLRDHGFEVVGVDISAAMLEQARKLDPNGDYRLVEENRLKRIDGPFDLILSTFTFDNVPTIHQRRSALIELRDLLSDDGSIINVVSSPEIYINEWASFSTKDFPENWNAKSGERVKIVMLDVSDRRPVEDVVFSDDDYRRIYDDIGLFVCEVIQPTATGEEKIDWVSELEVAPWTIYVLKYTRDNHPMGG